MRLRGPRQRPRWLQWTSLGAALLLGTFAGYAAYLNQVVTGKFEGKRWALPAQVYARPLDLYAGELLHRVELVEELRRLGYRRVPDPARPGTWEQTAGGIRMVTRRFVFWDGSEPSRHLEVDFDGHRVVRVRDLGSRKDLALTRLDPPKIGSIYAEHGEDRILVRLDRVPPHLTRALILTEDRRFYRHHGLDFMAMGRALLADIRAGAVVQGGSTLTQQLVKNFFLSNRRTLWRKFNEAIMAVLLEWHYRKDQILEAYMNEVYLGQDGSRAVHGFGLASQFYFRKPLSELRDHELALLVALVRGPSYYNPRRYPQRALARRNHVLDLMARFGVISERHALLEKQKPLGVPEHGRWETDFPAFIDLVKRQLQAGYSESDLATEGLRIFTTLDPRVQRAAEQALSRQIRRLEHGRGLPRGSLEAAAVVTDVENGQVLAVVGGRDPRFAGFNRALVARRPVGSLIKPAIYLTGLEQPRRYQLATLLDDDPVNFRQAGGRVWNPTNFSGKYHGRVPLYLALAHSYNAATANLGLALGVPRVIATLKKLGMQSDPDPYPSVLLGAVDMSPYQVAGIYHTIAAGGFRSPLRAIRDVLTRQGRPLSRYSLDVRPVVEPAPDYLITRALQEVADVGTARGVYHWMDPALHIAGKTGTTNDFRDSWFAGFTGNRLAVVWVGRDDDRPTGFTGASGALPIWSAIMRRIHPRPLELTPPPGVDRRWIDPASGLLADRDCPGAIQLPFIRGSEPAGRSDCEGGSGGTGGGGLLRWFRHLFQ